MNVLEKLQQGAGFTRKEAVALITLSATFLGGMGIKLLNSHTKSPEASFPRFEYRAEDSTYAALGKNYRAMQARQPDKSPVAAQTPARELKRAARVNINTATRQQLIALPGIGPASAERIIEYRSERGGFASVDELLKVKGIGKKKLEQLRPYVYAQ